MDRFNVLSDRDLCKKLKEFNIPIGPITSTTRPLYVKKLNEFVNSNKNLREELDSPIPENRRINMPGSAESKIHSPIPSNRTYQMDTPRSDPNASRATSNYASIIDDSTCYETPMKNFQPNVRKNFMYNHTDSPGHTPFTTRRNRVFDITDESPIRTLNLDTSVASKRNESTSYVNVSNIQVPRRRFLKYLITFICMAFMFVLCYALFGFEDKYQLLRPTILENITLCVTGALDRAQYLFQCDLPGSTYYGQMAGSDLYYNCKNSVKKGFNNYEMFIGKVTEIATNLKIKCFDANHIQEICTIHSQYFGRGAGPKDLMYCLFYTAYQSVFSVYFIILVFFLILMWYIAHTRLLTWLLYRDDGTKKLTEAVLIILRKSRVLYDKGYTVSPFVPVSFVRDTLIEYNQRSTLAKRWTCVVKMIENEPDVLAMKIKFMDINCDCWSVKSSFDYLDYAYQATYLQMKRWFPALNSVALGSIVKTKIPEAPSQYIKLANSHGGFLEIAYEWGDKLKEAVLERCALVGAQVKHISVVSSSDNRSIYVLAKNIESATRILNSFDGAFIDGCVIEAKCIPGNRYFSRFPAARSANTEIPPSGKYPTSIY